MHSYSIRELLRALRLLPATTPQSDRLFKSGYDTHKDHWTGWLEGYDGPGYYGQANWDRDARYVYQHLNCGPMIVWLNEASTEYTRSDFHRKDESFPSFPSSGY
jgi:hypothetical protein